jgi:phosphate transport system protein
MPRLMDIGLDRLKGMVQDMANLSQTCVAKSIETYMFGGRPTDEVFDMSEKLRFLQDEVGDLSVEIIAKYQPVASDLRFIRSCMEISYGFQRFGRYAYDIAQVLYLFENLSNCDKKVVKRAADQVNEMIKTSTNAFTNKDVELARGLAAMDDIVDDIYNNYIKSVVEYGGADLNCILSATLILRYLERIADHAKYIGDSVIYIVTGESSPRQ